MRHYDLLSVAVVRGNATAVRLASVSVRPNHKANTEPESPLRPLTKPTGTETRLPLELPATTCLTTRPAEQEPDLSNIGLPNISKIVNN